MDFSYLEQSDPLHTLCHLFEIRQEEIENALHIFAQLMCDSFSLCIMPGSKPKNFHAFCVQKTLQLAFAA